MKGTRNDADPAVQPGPTLRRTIASRRVGLPPRMIRRLSPYAFITPTVILIAVLMIVPIVMVITYSFMDNVVVQPSSQFVGLHNYMAVLTDPDFQAALRNTLIFIVASTAIHLVIGLTFAILLNTPLLGTATKAFFRVIYVLPWLFTVAVIAVLWRLILSPYGIANYMLTSLGLVRSGVDWLASPATALGAVTFINIWAGYPFFMISLLAGLQAVPTDLYEAAKVDGASAPQRFWSITLPQLRPIIVSMAVLDLIWTSQQFALIWMTTGGGPLNVTEVLSTFTYKQAFSNYEFSTASASAVIILLLSMILAFFYVKQQRAQE